MTAPTPLVSLVSRVIRAYELRDEFGLIPHVYFDWTEGSPLTHFLRFILWGSGEVAPGHPGDPAPGRTRPVPPPARARGLKPGDPRITAVSFPGRHQARQARPMRPHWLTSPGEGR